LRRGVQGKRELSIGRKPCPDRCGGWRLPRMIERSTLGSIEEEKKRGKRGGKKA